MECYIFNGVRSHATQNGVCRYRGSTDPIVAFDTFEDELYMVNSSGKLLVHDDCMTGGSQQTAVPAKVKGTKGISTVDVLPLNQLVLFGTDTGALHFYC